jgi:hypothetical protein
MKDRVLKLQNKTPLHGMLRINLKEETCKANPLPDPGTLLYCIHPP